MLIGVWDKDDVEEVGRPVVAMAEARRRDDGRTTRWSVFLQLAALLEAEATGWASDVTDSGETIRYLHPVMLPVAITASMNRTEPNEKSIYRSISTLGLLDPATDLTELPEIERVRRTVTSLVRDSKFSGAVLDAYARRCAMCGLGLGLVQGAHIYPASAPGSRDETSNGLALCANHHLAFDRYLIAIRPDTMEVIFNPSVLELAESDEAVSTFVRNTVYRLRVADAGHGPDPHAFDRRHDYFKEQYAWANLYRD
ncbi:MAG: HNH endonuclease [Kineosporiaceae bacterium]|nr:HNH endonuclease [Aeromicrobium sp.]